MRGITGAIKTYKRRGRRRNVERKRNNARVERGLAVTEGEEINLEKNAIGVAMVIKISFFIPWFFSSDENYSVIIIPTRLRNDFNIEKRRQTAFFIVRLT